MITRDEYNNEWLTALECHPLRCDRCSAVITEATSLYRDQPLCADCTVLVASYDYQRAARIDRLEARAEKKQAEAEARFQTAHNMGKAIPMGQPILVGHHSERWDRNYRARIDTNMRKGWETQKEADQLKRRAKAAEKNRAISSDDPLAVLKLQEKIDQAETSQQLMKDINKAIRKSSKLSHDEQVSALVSQFNITEKHAIDLLAPDFMGRIGFPDYALRNNGANIRRMKERVSELKTALTTPTETTSVELPQEEGIPGMQIIRNQEENRLQLVFDGKPSAAIRAILKSRGWRWAPSQGAWQRFLNGNSESALKFTLDDLKKIGQ